ncbi:nucleotidyl transferase AbiEii/AbiGii toxin family protein [Nocardiopsis sediminis]|uniref:Nucleotidyl transferase AbiEii/AbiGii toxin family protein n=1 Tax=Nocardiopsis sediminis TaxID=1778267 RepID=A0ABV8FNY9_9ACTN
MAGGDEPFASFWRDLTRRVRRHAHERGTTFEAEMQQWVLQRVMARLFAAQPDDWMIKGGQTLLALWPDARWTGDVDAVRTSPVPIRRMVGDYNHAMAQDFGDHLRFVPRGEESYEPYGWARITHAVFCGDVELMEVETDTVLPEKRPLRRPPEIADFPRHIHPSGDPRENPPLRMLSVTDTLGHKVSGIFSRYWEGGPSVRAQDLADLLFIADRVAWDGPEAHAVIHDEIAFQRAEGKTLDVGDRFELPNPTWWERYPRHAAMTPGLAYPTLDTAIPAAQRFLDPLLAPEPPQADWNPDRKEWVSRTAGPTRGPAAHQSLTALDNPRGAGPAVRRPRAPTGTTTPAPAQPAHDQSRHKGRGA